MAPGAYAAASGWRATSASTLPTTARTATESAGLAADASLIPNAVEELLRYVGPVQYNVRYTLRETEVPSGTIPAHKPVFLMKAAANRDPRAFDDGETFDITRDPNPHLGFGWGLHHCLGARLARAETVAVLSRLLERFPELRPAGVRHVPATLAGTM